MLKNHKLNKKLKIKKEFEKIKINCGIYRFEIENFVLEDLKILHISDTHFSESKNSIQKFSELKLKLKDEIFDIIIHTGDIINKEIKDFKEEYKIFFKKLKSNYGKYFIFGNHDYYSKRTTELEKIMKECDFENLTNNIKIIPEKKISIFGLDDVLMGKPNKSILNNIKENYNNILITHNLDVINKEEIKKFNLILSGHLHSGELNFGLFCGVDYLKLRKHYKNLNKQKRNFKLYEENCLSFISPGNHTFVYEKFKVPRVFTNKEGPVIMSFKSEKN